MCGIDRSFLGNVKDTFSGWGLAPGTMLTTIGYTLAAALVVFGLGLLVNHYVIKRRSRPPAHWIWRRPDLDRLFEQVMSQRAKVEMCFLSDGRRAACRVCSLESVGAESMEMELSSVKDANQTWIGRQVDCVFRLTNPKQPAQSTFYTLHSEIMGIKKLATGAGLLTIAFPEKVEISQKRMHLRLEPPVHLLQGMAIWPEQFADSGAMERQIKNWGKPSLVYVSGDRHNPFHIENLSGGGIRVGVERDAVRESNMQFEIGQTYILLLDLLEPEGQRKLRFWLMGRIQNRYEDFETRKLSFGMQFTQQGQRLSEPKNEMRWSPVSEAGIDELGNWAVRRHLELYRRSGLA